MMKLYGNDTINTLKVLLFLFEAGLDFEFEPINIRKGDQHSPLFRAVNPAGKVPVIWDGETNQTESNAILLSLANRAGWGQVDDQTKLIAWLFYQASTLGPYFGQIEHWSRFAKTPNPDALAHYHAIAKRSIAHLDDQLSGHPYICGDIYSIADIALFPWLRVHAHLGVSLASAKNLSGWLERVRARPATKKALIFFNDISTEKSANGRENIVQHTSDVCSD